MSEKLRKLLLAGALASSLTAASAPALAQSNDFQSVTKIGVLDMQADKILSKHDNVSVHYKEFTAPGHKPGFSKNRDGVDHGVLVASTLADEYSKLDNSRRLEIFAANPYVMRLDKPDTYAIMYPQAKMALDWMHKNGADVVVMTFNDRNFDRSKDLIDHAEELGMIVFASGSNTKDVGKVYPAADPRTIVLPVIRNGRRNQKQQDGPLGCG